MNTGKLRGKIVVRSLSVIVSFTFCGFERNMLSKNEARW